VTSSEEVARKMPNIKSAEKRVRTSSLRQERNKADRTLLKTNLKKFDIAVAGGNREEADGAYKVAVRTVDRSVSKGIIHKNKAARKKSQLASAMNNL